MSDEIERRVHLLESAARRAGSDVALNGATFEPVGEARTALLTAIAALRAERDKLAIQVRQADERGDAAMKRAHKAEDERDAAQAEAGRLRELVALAYGHLWCVNNEPLAPVPLRSAEAAAYAARRILRDTLTNEQRGNGIHAARAALESKS